MPRVVVAGNWKMNLTYTEAIKLATDINYGCNGIEAVEIIVAPPYVSLFGIKQVIGNGPVKLAAQNMFYEDYGAFTGEISPLMLRETCDYVILGHSERRMMFGESNQLVNMKAQSAIRHGMSPIICVGETTEERDSGEAENVIMKQLQESLENIIAISGLIIAYEPVWAIGTGETASESQIEETHLKIKSYLKVLFGSKGEEVPLLYGGSVNDKNAESLIKTDGVNGFLIGGASLKVDSFCEIINIVKNF